MKKLEKRSKSAGNILSRTSETLRSEIVVYSEIVKRISDHVIKHSKPVNDEQLGHYLAGLIDGDGHFSSAQQLVIAFSSTDSFLAYYIKSRMGHGNVKKVKNKNAYLFIVSNKKGMLRLIDLINGKLRTKHKYNQLIDNILNNEKYIEIKKINFFLNLDDNLNNYWLAGFSDADASFQIKIIKRINRNNSEIRLNFQIDQKKKDVLILIKDFIGGNIGYRKNQDTYYYGSTSFGSAKNVINYFDHFHLQSRKHISYLRWRKVYRLIQNKEHLTEKGLAKIIKLKYLIYCHEDVTTI